MVQKKKKCVPECMKGRRGEETGEKREGRGGEGRRSQML